MKALILEFQGLGPEQYIAVNDILGIDTETGEGDWPDGLLMHAAGVSDDGADSLVELLGVPSENIPNRERTSFP